MGRSRYTDEQKIAAIKAVQVDGRSVSSVARALGTGPTAVNTWIASKAKIELRMRLDKEETVAQSAKKAASDLELYESTLSTRLRQRELVEKDFDRFFDENVDELGKLIERPFKYSNMASCATVMDSLDKKIFALIQLIAETKAKLAPEAIKQQASQEHQDKEREAQRMQEQLLVAYGQLKAEQSA